jgi:signal transduction histidine kinase
LPRAGTGTTRIVYTPDTVRQWYLEMIKGASVEVLSVMPTVNAVQREERIGVTSELVEAAKRGVRVRVLSAEDEFIRDKLDRMRAAGIVVRRIETPGEAKFKLLVVDRRYSLVVETKDDTKKHFSEAVGFGTFSDSAATVSPFITIFEALWRETDVYEKMKETERIKDEFVNIAAHELRNPLMPILQGSESVQAAVEQLKGRLSPEEYDRLRSITGLIDRNVIRLINLTEDILQVSRMESGTLKLDLQALDLSTLIGSAMKDVEKKYTSKARDVKMVYEPSEGVGGSRGWKALEVYCDGSKMEQCVYNLLDNAMKFTEKGQVTISVSATEQEVVVQIQDMGPGIDPQMKDRLFEKFATKSGGGTGLGLYVTKGIVEAHGGRVWASSNLDGGATFGFALPRDLREGLPRSTRAPGEAPPGESIAPGRQGQGLGFLLL